MGMEVQHYSSTIKQGCSTIKQGWQWEWKYKYRSTRQQHYKARMAIGQWDNKARMAMGMEVQDSSTISSKAGWQWEWKYKIVAL